MKRLSLVVLAALTVASFTGCSHIPFLSRFSKKTPGHPKKESSHVATETEQEFKKRWVDKRASDLVSQGKSPDEARSLANQDFASTFPATRAAAE